MLNSPILKDYPLFLLVVQLGLMGISPDEQEYARRDILLNDHWLTVAGEDIGEHSGFEKEDYNVADWIPVSIPHNWDRYEGYRRLQHGNRHGYAWYRRYFQFDDLDPENRYFLFFEGVSSYATIFLNGEKVGEHAGGRTSFTLDVTGQINLKGKNLLAVRADHPPVIDDLPWVCGGCSEEYGFSEGSQPMGIFRPVHLIVTDPVRVEPFGVHVWNDTTVNENSAFIHVNTEVKNYADKAAGITLNHQLKDRNGNVVTELGEEVRLGAGEIKKVGLQSPAFGPVNLWSTDHPYLYTLVTEIKQGGKIIDRVETPYGIRWVKWDIDEGGTNQFYLNGKPVFINGTCEYEHNMGKSHAFSKEMVKARVSQIRSAGFNAFRDAHQPHNFRYHHAWDSLGILWWTQMAAHIWFDTPEFQQNFKQLMRDWVKERRNSPSVILWGLENESTLPTWFARECTQIIREMDPTSPSQRLVTTCNGGTGTDWNVPQNWTGTYGGNPDEYHEDVKRQQLIGEYGAWRTLDKHTEGAFDQDGPLSEDRMTRLMEKKVRLADSSKNQTCGHFQWIFNSHENPGRNQSGEAFRELDRVGPVNYKGLFSPWGEPADVYYMYRANYAPKETQPMVYIVSHTWPNRWEGPGIKDSIAVYSNCEEVELFNNGRSFGRQKHPGFGKHFQWDRVDVQGSILKAIGFVNGEKVAVDYVKLHHLPKDAELDQIISDQVKLSDNPERNYVYRINCGGPDYVDSNGNLWMADVHHKTSDTWGSTSWTDDFEDMPGYYASQRRTFDPILNTTEQSLFKTFRYGMDKLQYHFPVPDGRYRIEFHFVEPWYGTGGGLDCTDWRIFDVAVNGQTVIDDLDIWKEAGHDQALIKTADVEVKDGALTVSFPEVRSGQAVISAIAISSLDQGIAPAEQSSGVIQAIKRSKTWLDWGDQPFVGRNLSFKELPPDLFGAEWIQRDVNDPDVHFELSEEAEVYIALLEGVSEPSWLEPFDFTKTRVVLAGEQKLAYGVYKKRFPEGRQLSFSNKSPDQLAYIVFAKAAAYLEPPYDLKPKIPYDEDVAILETDDLLIEEKFGLGCVTFLANSLQKVSWPIKTGVADYHAIHFKFSNETGEDLTATFNLIAADGTLMQSDKIAFRQTPAGKYRQEDVFTKSMINAGAYRVQIAGEDLKGLRIRGIRVQ